MQCEAVYIIIYDQPFQLQIFAGKVILNKLFSKTFLDIRLDIPLVDGDHHVAGHITNGNEAKSKKGCTHENKKLKTLLVLEGIRICLKVP